MNPTSRFKSLAAVIASISVVGMAFGLNMPLLSLVLETQSVDSSVIGLNAAVQGVSTVVATPFIPRQIGRVGARSYLLLCLAAVSACILLLALFKSLTAWFVIRFVLGLALTGVFVVSEAWIIQIAGARSRGRVLGIYATVLSAGFAIGPLIIRLTGIDNWLPFAVSAGIVILAMIPIAIARAEAPKFDSSHNIPVTSFVKLAPTAIFAALVFGAAETCILSLLPSYGMKNGLGVDEAATLLTITGAGCIALQYLIGWLSDRFDRRKVLLVCAAVGVGGVTLLPWIIATPVLLWPVLFIWGGVIVGLYTVGLALLGEKFNGLDLAAANAAFIQAYGVGAIAGPALVGVAMSVSGPDGLPFALAVLFGCYLVFAAGRTRRNQTSA